MIGVLSVKDAEVGGSTVPSYILSSSETRVASAALISALSCPTVVGQVTELLKYPAGEAVPML